MKNYIELREVARMGAAFGVSLDRARALLSPLSGPAAANTLALASESLLSAAVCLDDLVRDRPDLRRCERLGREFALALRSQLDASAGHLDERTSGTLLEILSLAEEAADLVGFAVPFYRYLYDDTDAGLILP